MLIWSEDDSFQLIENAERFAAEIPKTALIRIPGAGHIPMENNPRLSRALSAISSLAH
jgi:pimeloyl-ACP methyl ester carboxylesterase